MNSTWEKKKLNEVVWFQEGPGVRKHQYATKGIKLLNVRNLVKGSLVLDNTEVYISAEEGNGRYKHFLVDEGDLIIGSSGIKVEKFEEKVAFVEKQHLPLCMNTSTIRFKTLDDNILNIKFFSYFLKSRFFKEQVQFHITGSAQLNFGPSHLNKMTILIPTIQEQQRIVDVLDKADEIRTKKKLANDKLDEFLKSTFIDMFGDPVTNSKQLPKVKFSDMGTLARGKSKHRPRNAPELLNGPYPLVQTGDVANAGLYLKSYSQTYSEIGLKQSKMWNAGTLCITIAANIAKTAILTFDACFPDSIVGFINNDKCNIHYIQFWLMFLQAILEAEAPQSAQKNINLEILNSLELPYPSLDLQNKFAEIVQKVEAQKEKNERVIEQMDNLFNSLMQQAFSNKAEFILKNNDNVISLAERRAILAGKIIFKNLNNLKFGSVKENKLFNIIDMHCELNLAPEGYQRMAAGPYIPEMRYEISNTLKMNNWFKEIKTGADKTSKVEYTALSDNTRCLERFEELYLDKSDEVSRILDYFYDKDTDYCEVFSTLYMCWNDLIIEDKEPTRELIIDEFKNHWSKEKQRFDDTLLLEVLDDISASHIIPRGSGVHTINSDFDDYKGQTKLDVV